MSVSDAEALIAVSVATGQWADLRDLAGTDRVVPADFLRRLLTGMPLARSDHQAITQRLPGYAPFVPAGDSAPVPVATAGLRLRGATMTGLLDLSDCGSEGGASLPALALEECRLLRTDAGSRQLEDDNALSSLDLSRASIASVSLKDSAFTYVAMFNARVAGAVDISGVKPLNGWTERDLGSHDMAAFRGAMQAVADAVRTGSSQGPFPALPAGESGGGATAPSSTDPHDYCWLDLSGSQIQGSILAQKVRLRAPRRDRAHLTNTRRWPRFALRLEGVQVAGTLDARGGSTFDGGLSLYLCEIRDEVWLGSGRLLKEQGVALDAQGARLGGLFAIADPPLRILGTASLNSARIAGHVNLRAADIDGDGGPSLLVESATIGGDMTLGAGVAARGPVEMSGTSIDGILDMRGALLSGVIERERAGAIAAHCCDALHGRNLSVGSDALFSDGFTALGCVSLSGARIGDDLDLRGATLVGAIPSRYRSIPAVERDSFSPADTGISALSGSDMAVGGCARIGGGYADALMFRAFGTVRFQRASVGKDLDIIHATFIRPASQPGDWKVLDLDWIAVSGTLILTANQFDGAVSLEHASTNILCDDESGYRGASNLRLNGFTYQALYEPSQDLEGTTPPRLVGARKAWLNRMRPYRPQPYAILARVLRHHGRPDEARDILVEKYRREREERVRRLSWALLRERPKEAVSTALAAVASSLWGTMFGFGLKPTNAMVTLLLAFLVGWAFFFYANWRGAMVIDQQPIAGYVQGDQMGALRASGEVAVGVRCHNSIAAELYALDVFIPLVDLRQESKCEMGQADDAHGFFDGVLINRVRLFGEIELYRYGKALYALSGWLLISLSILTFSGVLQRRDAEE